MKRKCKICGGKFETNYLNKQWCSDDCFQVYKKRHYEKQYAKQKERLEKNKTTSPVSKKKNPVLELQRVFNQFIRQRDEHQPCISCGALSGVWHAGHYRSVGSSPELRFNELNVHKQCAKCNIELDGNIKNYRIGLIKRIGLKNVEWLEGYHPLPKLSKSDIEELTEKYKKALK